MPMMTLTPNQKLAYDLLLPFLKGQQGDSPARLAVLEGHAGTGKTFLVARLLAALEGFKIAVAAPTHKAVRVLRDKLIEADVPIPSDPGGDATGWRRRRSSRPIAGCSCHSIHSLLGLRLVERDDGSQDVEKDTQREATLRDYDVVVIDECSMIDAKLFARIVIESRPPSRVLFVGDSAQLPPIASRNETHEGGETERISPVFGRVMMRVRLTGVVRQARDNPMIQLSTRLRQLIEAGVRATPGILLESLPPVSDGPKAVLVSGTAQMLVDWYLSQISDDPESDTRIIAYTNDMVQQYNRQVHRTLHGESGTRFVAGERVIVQSQCEVEHFLYDDLWEPARLITSDELTVLNTRVQTYLIFPEIAANRIEIQGHDGARYRAWIAADDQFLERRISWYFSQWRALKRRSDQAREPKDRDQLKTEANTASAKGWALKNAFAPLRHAYAITCHKSQGSTFDCALVDFTDMNKMRDVLEFNRALYVAVTRSREFLAMVVR